MLGKKNLCAMTKSPFYEYTKILQSLRFILLLLTIGTTCDKHSIYRQSITLPHNTFVFNTGNQSIVYLCIPYLGTNQTIYAYILRNGVNILDQNSWITFYQQSIAGNNECSGKTHAAVSKFTNYHLLILPHNSNFASSFNYTAMITLGGTTKNFSGTFYNNGKYFNKTMPYQPCLDTFELNVVPPAGAPNISITVAQNYASSITANVISTGYSMIVNNLVVNQPWSYQISYGNTSAIYQIYEFNISLAAIIANETAAYICCNQSSTPNDALCKGITFDTEKPQPEPQPEPEPEPEPERDNKTGKIVGAVIGSAAFLSLLIAVGCYLYRQKTLKENSKKRRDPQQLSKSSKSIIQQQVSPKPPTLGNWGLDEYYYIDKCAVCDRRGLCNVQCGACQLKFHYQCIQKWRMIDGKCPRQDCRWPVFQSIIYKT